MTTWYDLTIGRLLYKDKVMTNFNYLLGLAGGSTVLAITSSATPAIDTDQYNSVDITALAVTITSMTSGLSGTPSNMQKLIIRIKDDGTSRGITWGADYAAMGVALPSATTLSKVLTVGFLYDSAASTWGCVASAEEA